MLTLDGPARAWEPRRLRLRLFTAAGEPRRAAAAPRRSLALDHTQIAAAISRLQALAPG